MFSVSEVLDIAIQIEENGERFYRKAMEHATPALKQQLAWLAREESLHRARFLKMKVDALQHEGGPPMQEISGTLLKSVVDSHLLSLDEVDIRLIHDEAELIKVAIDFEADCIIFYEIIRSFLLDSASIEQFEAITDEERKHLALLKDMKKGCRADTDA